MTKTCSLCETAPATLVKREAERDWDDLGEETVTVVEIEICAECAETYYDGTEDFPGTRAL